MKRNKSVSYAVISIILLFSLLNIVQFLNGGYRESQLSANHLYPSKAVYVLNSFVRSVFNIDSVSNSESEAERSRKEQNSLSKLFFFIMGSIVFINDKNLYMLLVNILFLTMDRRIAPEANTDTLFIRLKGYLIKMIGIVTPVQFCIENRCDEFDINPIKDDKCFTARILYCFSAKCGFFLFRRKQ